MTVALDRQTTTAATESGTTATTKHAIHATFISPKSLLGENNYQTMRYRDELPKSLLGENNYQTMRYRDECMPLVPSVDTVYLRPTSAWHILATTTGGTIFPLVSCVKKLFPPVIWYTLPPCHI